MDALEKYVNENLLSKENILKYVDDYSLYSHYIGEELELNTKYSSPLRDKDDDPSFSIFYSKYVDKILFKDQALGIYGDVFEFIGQLGGLSPTQVLAQINSDFDLGFTGNSSDTKDFKPRVLKSRPIKKPPVTIKITYRENPRKDFIEYWDFLGVPKSIQDMYYITNPEAIHFIQGNDRKVLYPRDLVIAYEILGKYKIYFPYEEKRFKFRNNFERTYVEGALQLQFNQDFAIITKSMKECAFMRAHFGWEAVAGTSETSMISEFFMNNILGQRYKKVFIWLDPDEAGKRSQLNYITKYPWLIPIETDSRLTGKDPTDIYTNAKKVGKEQVALKYLRHLIETKL